MTKALVLLGAWLAAAPFAPVASSAPAEALQARLAMGTLFEIEASGPDAPRALDAAFAEIQRLDAALSTYKPDSELSRANRAAGRGWTPVSSETAALVARALGYAAESDGAFDPTVGPLVALWGFKHLDYRVPSEAELASARRRTGYARAAADAERGALKLAAAGMTLDLGAIAKGYAVDRALGVLKAHGMRRARVDAGGNQGVWAQAPSRWAFGVKHPRDPEALLGAVGLSSGGISTSGDAERGFWKDGVRYGHLIDPRTGRPASGLLSVTVVAPDAEQADALSTALYVLGEARGRALLKRHPGCAALFVAAGPAPGTYRCAPTPGLDWRPLSEPPAAP